MLPACLSPGQSFIAPILIDCATREFDSWHSPERFDLTSVVASYAVHERVPVRAPVHSDHPITFLIDIPCRMSRFTSSASSHRFSFSQSLTLSRCARGGTSITVRH